MLHRGGAYFFVGKLARMNLCALNFIYVTIVATLKTGVSFNCVINKTEKMFGTISKWFYF